MFRKFVGVICCLVAGCQNIQHEDNDNEVFQKLVAVHKKYGATPKDWAQHEFQTHQIQPCVIIAPTYSPKNFEPYVKKVTQVSKGRFTVYEIETKQGQKISFIRAGVGACNTMDAVLALSETPCQKILFIGSVCSLSEKATIGDIIVPSESVAGCGADIYLTTGSFMKNNVIGNGYLSDSDSSAKLTQVAKKFSQIQVVNEKVFSIDTVIGEYLHTSEIQNLGCEALEMETATLFHAAKIAGKKATALLYVVDCTLEGQTLYHGRTEESDQIKTKTKKEILPQVALEFFQK